MDGASPPEPTADFERDRIAREVAIARAEVAAGYYATSAEVKAWIDSLGTTRPLPAPDPKASRTR